MADVFVAYETEFVSIRTALGRVFEAVVRESGERRKVTLKKAEKDIHELEGILQSMDLDVRASSGDAKAKRSAALKGYKDDLTQIKASYRKAVLSADQNEARERLFAESGIEMTDMSSDQRQRLLVTEAKVNKTTRTLDQVHRVALETEEIGTTILSDLSEQRQTLIRAKESLDHANDNIARARTIVSSMGRRMVTNKILLYFVIFVLLGSICLIIYYKFIA